MVLYRKVGKRYKEVGMEFTGFPCNGVWLVQDGRREVITMLSEIPDLPKCATMYRAELRDKILKYISKRAKEAKEYSFYDVATWACDALAHLKDKCCVDRNAR